MSLPLQGRLVLLGAGKMGGAMLAGWLDRCLPAAQVVALDPGPPPEVARMLAERGVTHNPTLDDLGPVEVIVVAVKPQIMEEALQPVAAALKSQRPLVLSVAAGKTIASFERHFGADAAIIRSIPNTPAAVGRGITAMVASRNVSARQRALGEALLEAIGEVVVVDDEGLIDAATAVSGSGPAYVFYLTECLAAAARTQGLPDDVAVKLARATVAGAGELMRQSGLPAETLRVNVTSPKGTTYAALQVLMDPDNGLEPMMRRAVDAATRRSRELAG
jgi:pyrroline-5-carboxylate reductase